jgi:hypothetical protein
MSCWSVAKFWLYANFCPMRSFLCFFPRKSEFRSTTGMMQDHLWNSIAKLILMTNKCFKVLKFFVSASVRVHTIRSRANFVPTRTKSVWVTPVLTAFIGSNIQNWHIYCTWANLEVFQISCYLVKDFLFNVVFVRCTIFVRCIVHVSRIWQKFT